MPVEIKELVIRMVGKLPPSSNSENMHRNGTTSVEQDVIIAACVKEVLKVLEKKQKR